jgi:hypothetical protein
MTRKEHHTIYRLEGVGATERKSARSDRPPRRLSLLPDGAIRDSNRLAQLCARVGGWRRDGHSYPPPARFFTVPSGRNSIPASSKTRTIRMMVS